MKKIILTLTILLVGLISFSQIYGPPPDKTTTDEMFKIADKSYQVVNNMNDDPNSVLFCITMLYHYKDSTGKGKTMFIPLNDYKFYVFQIFTKDMVEYPNNYKYVFDCAPTWEPGSVPDGFYQVIPSVCGIVKKPSKQMWMLWIAFNTKTQKGMVAKGNFLIGPRPPRR